ncbi:uncharacterized protein [Euwallacea similis]|uniref:uncharacterized protein n=1 Tax=Euwallacea similis TaxID=1736056 RepID=UPI00344E9175
MGKEAAHWYAGTYRDCERETAHVKKQQKSGSAFCKELLKDSLMSLIHYCDTVRKMKTAVASVPSQEIINNIEDLNNNQSSEKKGEKCEGMPLEEDDKKYISPTGKTFITGDKHTEVFQIRARRSLTSEKKPEEVPVIKRKFKPAAWDVLNVMKLVQYSFLGGIWDDGFQPHVTGDQPSLIDVRELRKQRQDPELFDMVKTTLNSLLNRPEKPFLMTIFGGHLHSIAEPHSPIVQSIKYVMENTESKKTLIVVTDINTLYLADDAIIVHRFFNVKSDLEISERFTTSCMLLTGSYAGDAEQTKSAKGKKDSCTIPVYAKGPNYNILAECKLLYDIPLIIRKILEVHSASGKFQIIFIPHQQ